MAFGEFHETVSRSPHALVAGSQPAIGLQQVGALRSEVRSILEPPRMVELRTGGASPLFCLPGIGGDPKSLSALAGALPEGRGFVSFTSPKFTDQPSVSDMASAILPLVRSRQEKGPYHLGGHSYGAIIAYELARQLESHGEKVRHLFLLDHNPPPFRYANKWPGVASVIANIPLWLREEKRGRSAGDVAKTLRDKLAGRATNLWSRLRGSATPATAEFRQAFSSSVHPVFTEVATEKYAALKAYEPAGHVNGMVNVFRANARPLFHSHQPDLNWGKLVPPHLLHIHGTPGNHLSMIKPPHVASLAERIREILDS